MKVRIISDDVLTRPEIDMAMKAIEESIRPIGVHVRSVDAELHFVDDEGIACNIKDEDGIEAVRQFTFKEIKIPDPGDEEN